MITIASGRRVEMFLSLAMASAAMKSTRHHHDARVLACSAIMALRDGLVACVVQGVDVPLRYACEMMGQHVQTGVQIYSQRRRHRRAGGCE